MRISHELRTPRDHEGAVRTQPPDSARGVRAGPAHRVRERREPAARPRRRAARSDRGPPRDGRLAPADRDAGAVESVLLAVGGGIAGLVVAVGAARLLLSLAFAGATFLPIDTRPAPLVLAFASSAWRSSPASSSAPRRRGSPRAPIRSTRCAARAAAPAITPRSRARALLVVQATLSVVLVAGSTMLARSLGNLERQDFGFELENRVLVASNRPPADYTAERLAALYREHRGAARSPAWRARRRARALQPAHRQLGRARAGRRPSARRSPDEQAGASWDRVSANYLQNLGVTLVRGRHFTAADNETPSHVAVVNEAFVRRFFKSDEDPIDQHFGLDVPENVGTYRIVGIVRDAKFAGFGLDRPARPMFYVPLAQTVNYTNPMMKRLETQSHFVRGLLLVTSIAARHARTAGQAGAGRGRSEPDRDERADAAGAGRSLVRSAARGREPGGIVRRRRAGARRDRSVRRDGLHRGAADERDRRPHGARRRSRQVVAMVLQRRVPPRGRRPGRSGCRSPSAQADCSRRSCTACGSGIRSRSAWPRCRSAHAPSSPPSFRRRARRRFRRCTRCAPNSDRTRREPQSFTMKSKWCTSSFVPSDS